MIRHYSVMYRNVLSKIQSLKMSRALKVADCNFGFGGHSHFILRKFPNALIQGFDIDPQVLEYYKEYFHKDLIDEQKHRLSITNDNYTSLLSKNHFQEYDVVLADFGFNNYHINTPRGFSWLQNDDLEMRYSNQSETCKSIRSSLLQLRQIFQKYTDLKQSKLVAESIFTKKPIKTTFQLRDAVVSCFQKEKQKKMAQVFQAFRIATNRQLEDVQKLCQILQKRLARNGMAIFITFHSIERDRVIKRIKQQSSMFEKVSIQTPYQEQLNENSMSRSAKLLTFRRKN